MQQPQQGFHVGIILAVIAAVVVAGLVAWRVYDANRQQPQTQQQTQPNQEVQTSEAQSPSTDSNEGYVFIKEWGVHFKPVEGADALIYYQPDESKNLITFTTQALAAADPNCAPSSGNQNVLGALERSQTPLEAYEETYGQIDGYYYYYFGPQSVCSANQDQWDAELQQKQYVKQSLESLEAAK